MTPVEEPQGLGTPSSGQPEFSPPAAGSPQPAWDGSVQPPQSWPAPSGPPPAGWAPPTSAAPPPSGRGPQPRRRSRTRVVAAAVAVALVLIALLSALPLISPASSPSPAPSTAPTPAPPPATSTEPSRLVTVSPTPQPTTSTPVSGGDVGVDTAFTTTTGSGRLVIQDASWTLAGDAAPPEGKQYLVLDVSVAAQDGVLAVDALTFLATGSDGKRTEPGFGPALDRPLGGSEVAAGASVTGQVGFVLPPGATTVSVLDENLVAVAELKVPGP